MARYLGAGDQQGAEAIALHAVVLALLFSALFAALFLLGGAGIFSFLGGKGVVLKEVLAYSNVLFAGILAMWLCNSLGSVIRGTGQMKVASFWMIVASATQVVAGGVLILGFGPIPSLGIAGAAYAAILGFGLGALGQLVHLLRGRGGVRLRIGKISLPVRYFTAILRIGLVAAFNSMATAGTTIVITGFAARLGDAALAGYGIGSRLEFLMVPLIFGIGAACIAMIGVHFGAGEIDRGHRIGWIGGLAAAGLTGTIGLVFAAFPWLWADLFSDNEAVREACSAYLWIVGPAYAFFGLGLCLYFSSQGAGRVFWPTLGSVIRFLVILGVGLLMFSAGEVTLEGLFLLMAIGLVIYGCVIAGSIKLGAWRGGTNMVGIARQGAD